MLQSLPSAAVVIGALRDKGNLLRHCYMGNMYFHYYDLKIKSFFSLQKSIR